MTDSKKKETIFEGYMSGDCECFCLSKVPFAEWQHLRLERRKAGDILFYPDPLLFYPSEFFPSEAHTGKWRFKIVVEIEQLEEISKKVSK